MKKTLLAGVSLALLHFLPTAARAQPGPGAGTAEPVSGGDIIVTAQKRSQNLQDVPVAVTALTGASIGPAGTTDVTGLGSIVPNVSVGTQFGIAQIFIRGVGLDNTFTGADPSVAMHVDGAVISQSVNQLGSFFDLERVEVLRGPQGTLYGRNSTGGVINLITAKPTAQLSGYLRATYGNYDQLVVEGAISGPLATGVLARLAVRTEDRSGFGHNPVLGTQVDNANKRSLRGEVAVDLAPTVNLLLTGELHHEDDAAYGLHFKAISFPGQPATSPIYGLGQGGYASYYRDIASEGPIQNKRQTWSVSSILDAGLAQGLTLKSTTNYRKYYNNPLLDLDASAVVEPTRNSLYSEGHQFSQELQLSLNHSRFHGLISAYYFNEYLFGDNRIGLNPSRDASPALQSLRVEFAGNVKIRSEAIFGQATYDLTDTISLTAGGRFTHEHRVGDSTTRSPAGIFLSKPEGSFDNFSPRATIEWRPVGGVMAYATYSRGFKSGIILTGQTNPILRPEKVENFEAGIKTTLFDRLLTLDLTAFRDNFRDLQVGKSVPSATGTSITTVFENAAAARTWGVELESTLRPMRGLSLSAAGGYLNARFGNYLSANPLELNLSPPSPLRQLNGNTLVQAPKWTLNLRGAYETVLENGSRFTLAGDMDYKSKIFFTAFNNDQTSQPGRVLFNASTGYRLPNKLSLSLWVKNLTNRTFFSTNYVIATSRLILATYAPPRTYGVTAGFEF